MTQQSSSGRESDQIGKVEEQASDHFNKVAGGRDAGESIQEVAGNFKSALDRSVREQPMAMLLVAGIIGFLVGAIWKS
jgi:ElaB/YqjD/DUF883 family membrane-anchored ribosome-binding protein